MGTTVKSMRQFSIHMAVILALLVLIPSTVWGQFRGGSSYPGAEYDLVFRSFYQGEYRAATRGFKDASRGGIRGVNFVWIDAVCYSTMAAECHFHVGDLSTALELYNDALRVYLANKDWVKRLDFKPDQVRAAVPERITWGPKARSTVPGDFPNTVNSVQTSLTTGTIGQGDQAQTAIAQQQTIYPLRVGEVMRCTALAIARRNEILGPAAARDTLSSQIERRLASHNIPPNHWSKPLFDVCLAVSRAGLGQTDEAYSLLQKSLTFGQLDHLLTPLGLLEMAKIAIEKGELDAAATNLYEATFPAADFAQLDVLEEATKLAADVHRLKNPTQPLPILDQISGWARVNRYTRVASSISVASAYLAFVNKNAKLASQYLTEANRSMARTDLMMGNLGARYHFANAAASFLAGREREGSVAYSNFLKVQNQSSVDLFRVVWVFNQARQDLISESAASRLFRLVLKIPTAKTWRLAPMDALTMEEASQFDVLEYWMELELKRDQIERVVEIADRIRAKKFTAQDTLFARLMNLRWLLEAPDILLDGEAKLQKQEIVVAFPEWKELSDEVTKLQQELKMLPVLPEDADKLAQWQQLASRIRQLSTQQERLLRKIALRPEGTKALFPPIRSLDEIQSGLRPGQAVLDIISTKRQIISILITKEEPYNVLGSRPTGREQKMIVSTLKAFGNYDRNKPVLSSQLSDQQWQKAAQAAYSSVFSGISANTWSNIDELIVVPDGQYWYVPFEALTFESNGVHIPLISACRIRYVPMASLAGNDPRRRTSSPSTFIVAGRIYGSENDPRVAEVARQIAENDADAAITSKPLPVSSSEVGSRWDRLVVLNDIKWSDQEPFSWKPAQADGKDPKSTLNDWMALPWAAPQQLVLAGFDTAASGSVGTRATGNELFLTSMGLLSTGCRTVLLSRWRSGGQTSLDIVREFVSQLAYETPSSSLQRSLELARSSSIDPELEPRVRSANEQNLPNGEHPFFWAGYQLIDLGQPAVDPQN